MIFSTNFEADRTWIKSPRKLKKAEEKKEEKEEILMLSLPEIRDKMAVARAH